MGPRSDAPTRTLERELWSTGADVVVGIDEVGRGAWAGPLAVGAVVVPRDRRVNGIRDSKLLTARHREELFDRIVAWCDAWAVGTASHDECDRLGMAAAQRLATARALDAIRGAGVVPDAAVSDGKWDFVSPLVPRVEMRVGADRLSLSVATASVLAKVVRDREMRALAEHYPYWSFETNKGYPCPVHQTALRGWGPSAVHRRSWAFMDALPWTGVPRFDRHAQPRLF